MCGFVGVTSSQPHLLSRSIIESMRDRMIHRGPDDSGFWSNSTTAFGFRRLSIIDLEGGHQPMVSADGRVSIVFNGEIYNFQELRKELISRNYRFMTNSDTEVILHGYLEYGCKVFEKLNGMFAIAISDSRDRSLVLARDRTGEKPLHFIQQDDTLVFGSEIKSLRPHPFFNSRMDWNAFLEFFTFGYIGAPRTIYESVKKIKPAHYAIFKNSNLTEHRYWGLKPGLRFQGSYDDALAQTRDLLEDAVRIRMVSDVPLGAFLSGGIDSSSIVALMARNSSRPIRTFTIEFGEKDYDESESAKLLAVHCRSEHTTLKATADLESLIEPILSNFDEPFGDSSALPTYLVSKLTRNHVTVALSGDGGDELFGGYSSYQFMLRQARLIGHVPSPLRPLLADSSRYFHPASKASRWLKAAGLDEWDRFVWSQTFFKPRELQSLLSQDVQKHLHLLDECRKHKLSTIGTGFDGAITPLQYSDLVHYLPDDILVKVDRTSMLSSLESRAPFLDHRLIELAFSLPEEWKVTPNMSKAILKKALVAFLPPQLLKKKKQGFGVPIKYWFAGPLHEYCRSLLLSREMEPCFNLNTVSRYLDEHRTGRYDHAYKLWFLLSFGFWVKHK